MVKRIGVKILSSMSETRSETGCDLKTKWLPGTSRAGLSLLKQLQLMIGCVNLYETRKKCSRQDSEDVCKVWGVVIYGVGVELNLG